MKISHVVLLFSAVSGPADAAKMGITESWGKSHIGYAQYRQDSVSCISQGYYKDISGTTAAKSFVEASRKMENRADQGVTSLPDQPPDEAAAQFASDMKQIENGIRPEERMKEVKTLQQSLVDACLQKKGYTKFRLTKEQTQHLSRIPVGREAHHEYLFELARDPDVLAAQAIETK